MRTHIIPSLAVALLAAPLVTPAAAQNRHYDIEWMRGQGATINGDVASDGTGDVITNAGDMNGDGFDDFVITAWRREIGGNINTGRAWIAFGASDLAGTSKDVSDASIIEILADTTQTGGFTGPQLGLAASAAGDVDNDGFDDVIIGSPRADPNGTDSGIAYLIYGSDTLPSVIDTASLGSNGVVFAGAAGGDLTGQSVGGGGDVNGDGFDDLIIGARGADPNGSNSGYVYIVYGSDTLPSTFQLGDLLTMSGLGVALEGGAASDKLGEQCGFAGDVNNDGFGDVLAGAPDSDPNGKANAGRVYVVFGGSSLPDTIDMLTLGPAGITLNGAAAGNATSDQLGGAGDINDDGFDDIVFGSSTIDTTNGIDSGRVYVYFGSAGASGTVDLGSLGSAGIVIDGAAADDNAGSAVACNGDVNRDGFDDIAIGIQTSDPSSTANAGQVAIIYGGTSLPSTLDLGNLGALGVMLDGIGAQDLVGSGVCIGGDYDNDGFDDVLFGARQTDPGGTADAGTTYMLKGACHWAHMPGAVVEGVSVPMRAFGTPGVTFQIFVAFDTLPVALPTKFGPWSLTGAIFPLSILSYDAIGQFDAVFPFPTSSPSAVGLETFMHFLQVPQGDKCDLSNLVDFVIE